MSFTDVLPIEDTSSPIRSRSSTKKSPSKEISSQFQISSPGKIFKHSQVKIAESSIFSEDPLLMNLSKQLQGTIESFDNKMQQVLHKQESNFLFAYKGVIRDVALDLKHYQGQLEKTSEEYKESENAFLKQEMIRFREEIKAVVEINKAVDADNKKLRQMVINLKEELKSEQDITQKVEEDKKALQNLCDSLKESLARKEKEDEDTKALPPKLKVVSERDNFQGTDRSTQMASHALLGYEIHQSKAGSRFLGQENSAREKFSARVLTSDRNQVGSHEFILHSAKRSKSPIETQADQAGYAKMREYKYLADTVGEALRKKIGDEDEVRMLTEKIVYSASLFLRQKIKEVKVLKEVVERQQKTIEQKEKMLDRSFESIGDYQKNENKLLREIFRECVDESTKSFLDGQQLLASSVEFFDPEKRNEIRQRVKLFERYLSDPRVVPFLESVIAERPIEGPSSKDLSNLNSHTIQITHSEDYKQVKLSEGAVLNNTARKLNEIVSDSRTLSDASTHWNHPRGTHRLPRVRESLRAMSNNDSMSELLSDKQSLKKQSLAPIHTQASNILNQGSGAIQLSGSQIHSRNSRSNSNGIPVTKLARGRTKLSQKNDSSYLQFDRKASTNVTTNEGNSSFRLLNRTPLSRRILVKNGKLVLNAV